MNRSQPTAAEQRVLRADAARVREQQPTAQVVDLPTTGSWCLTGNHDITCTCAVAS